MKNEQKMGIFHAFWMFFRAKSGVFEIKMRGFKTYFALKVLILACFEAF